MTLCDNPIDAMQEIASYLRCVNCQPQRKALDRYGDLAGFWQTPEYLDGCLEIADECERIISLTRESKDNG